jgi:hypothetical protein
MCLLDFEVYHTSTSRVHRVAIFDVDRRHKVTPLCEYFLPGDLKIHVENLKLPDHNRVARGGLEPAAGGD